MKNNWETIGIKITRTRQKVKKRLDTKRNPVTIKPGDKTLLSTKNLTDNKLDTPYIGTFKMLNVKNTTVELSLPDTKIFPKFHAFLIKKTAPDTPLTTTWNYSTKEKYEIKRILQKKQGDRRAKFLVKWKNYRNNMGAKSSFEKRPNNFKINSEKRYKGEDVTIQV